MKNTSIFASALAVVLMLAVVAPSVASAQSIGYQPRTQAEMIAYLYGRITQLMEIKAMLERGAANQGYYQSDGGYSSVAIDTYSAQSETHESAILRGEVVLYGDTTATAWFEYGEDEDFLDLKTRKASVRSAYDRAIRQQVRYLDDDERYYFRIVAQTNNGKLIYGPIESFRTDEID